MVTFDASPYVNDPYRQHRPNLATLLSPKQGEAGYEELENTKQNSLFQYYKNIVGTNIAGAIYLYVSTRTVYTVESAIFINMTKHTDNNCYVAVLSAEPELYKQFLNAKLGP